MRKVSRNVKVQLEQAVDNALQKGNHHGWALIMMVFFAVAREGLGVRVLPARGFSAGRGHLAAAGRDARAGHGGCAWLPALLGRHSS